MAWMPVLSVDDERAMSLHEDRRRQDAVELRAYRFELGDVERRSAGSDGRGNRYRLDGVKERTHQREPVVALDGRLVSETSTDVEGNLAVLHPEHGRSVAGAEFDRIRVHIGEE